MSKNDDKLLKKAWKEAQKLNEGETFLVKDLFKGYKWKRLAVEQRATLGKLFLEKVRRKETVDALEKNSANQQMYVKVEE